MGPAGGPIEAVFREERGRLLALLAARFGDLDLAEEVTAEALLAAVETLATLRGPARAAGMAGHHGPAQGPRPDPARRHAGHEARHLHADADPALAVPVAP